jgi:hypothetical protein
VQRILESLVTFKILEQEFDVSSSCNAQEDGAPTEKRSDGSGLVPLMDLLNHHETHSVSAHLHSF